jgi:hypothetical protein
MSDIVQASGIGGEFQWGGKVWRVAPFGPGIRAELTRFARRTARENVENDPDTKPAEKRQNGEELRRDIRSGYYDYGSAGAAGIFSTDAGAAFLILTLLRPAHADITEETVLSMAHEADEAIGQAIKEANHPLATTAKK